MVIAAKKKPGRDGGPPKKGQLADGVSSRSGPAPDAEQDAPARPGSNPSPDVLPELSADGHESLREGIRKRGVQVPVEIDAATEEVLDGRARVMICRELGIRHYPRRVVTGLDTEEDRRHHRLRANCLRRQMDRSTLKGLVLAEMRRKPQSDRLLASIFGLAHSTIGVWRREFSSTGRCRPVGSFTSANGKTFRRPTAIYATTPVTASRAAELLNALGEDAPGRELSPRAAEKLLLGRRREQADARVVAAKGKPGVLAGRFQDLGGRIGDATVDAIWTDPPYSRAWVEDGQWADLGGLAARVLRPGGVLATYCGVAYLDRVLPQLCGAGLAYFWTFSVRYSGLSSRNYQVNAINKWKPILVFGKGRAKFAGAIPDSWEGGGRVKALHEWEQPEQECLYWLHRLAGPGSVVLDPCCGSGTTLVCAGRVGMRSIGFDCDPGAVALARARLAGKATPRGESSGSPANAPR
ncbi:DNA methyltransferase [Tautonia plasticadhaerens]|uniref:Methyltransferase n=1 Tax=Tautonia plasticadhaerens TaxID=2527974 RepID=A0A518HFG5_9BACT|nr:DNA methyltransferase [Tautonia plasticadhaerens]QDV39558.1 DNA methylase [Tautonia plasticadhaerens]